MILELTLGIAAIYFVVKVMIIDGAKIITSGLSL